jgi:hypothetical protein
MQCGPASFFIPEGPSMPGRPLRSWGGIQQGDAPGRDAWSGRLKRAGGPRRLGDHGPENPSQAIPEPPAGPDEPPQPPNAPSMPSPALPVSVQAS